MGKNLTAVSQLDGLTFDLYCDSVLPRVMEQIISCRDDIAQQYLMQAVIQVGQGLGAQGSGFSGGHIVTDVGSRV